MIQHNIPIIREYINKSIPINIRKTFRIDIDTRRSYNKKNVDLIVRTPVYTAINVDSKFNIEIGKYGYMIRNGKGAIYLPNYKNGTPCVYVW